MHGLAVACTIYAGAGIDGTEMILSNRAIRQHTSAICAGMVVVVCVYLYIYVVEARRWRTSLP